MQMHSVKMKLYLISIIVFPLHWTGQWGEAVDFHSGVLASSIVAWRELNWIQIFIPTQYTHFKYVFLRILQSDRYEA
jgi:hypothetical protein